ncbi:hypothetical protein DFH09DRAFT_1096840 [Mycena vulgaris]|nr:hypothetical protein DFH09DRAFT_1096840 [Mycena vulgaris]
MSMLVVRGSTLSAIIDTNISTAHKHVHEETSEDDSDDGEDALMIADVLRELNNMFPALNYLQYSDVLAAQGIIYASSAMNFDKAYYKENVGMADGAIGQFIKQVGKMVKAAKKHGGKKRARLVVVDDNTDN